MPDRRRWFELEQENLKEKLDEELHSIARPLEELVPGDSYFVKVQGILAMKNELENIPLSGTQRDMLLAMENVLEQAWTFRNTPIPNRCMNPENISEVIYYFLQDKGAEYRSGLLYNRAKAEFDARMEEIAVLPPDKILDYAYEKVIKEEFLCQLEEGLDEWETDTLLTYSQPLAVLYTEWLGNDYSFWDRIQNTLEETVAKQAADLRRCAFHVNGEPPVEMKDFYDLHGDELNDTGLEPAGEIER